MRILFMGTPDFSVVSLEALVSEGYEVSLALAQPPRPAGRGHAPRQAPVAARCLQLDIPILTPVTLRDQGIVYQLQELKPDVAVVVAYGLILPAAVLKIPRYGCLNIHASLLPRWRGAAPIQRAILAGDHETGVTIMAMDEGLDTGEIITHASVPILPTTTASELHDQLAALGTKLILDTLGQLKRKGSLQTVPQIHEGACYAVKLARRDGWVDWRQSAHQVNRQTRALNPWPGVMARLPNGDLLKILKATPTTNDQGAAPGTIVDDQFTVACGEGAVHLVEVQRPGRMKSNGAACLRGLRITPGTSLPTTLEDGCAGGF